MTYKDLPGSSKVWIYQSDREFSNEECDAIREQLNDFVKSWAAHGSKLMGAGELFYNRFLVLFIDEQQVIASGCSVDSSVNFVKSLEAKYSTDFFNRLNIAYRNDNSEIKLSPMGEFENLVKEGKLNENSIVFNNLVTSLDEFQSEWEVPIKNSWHSRFL